MYDNFTDRARKSMWFANQEAQRLGHDCITGEHILLGLLEEGGGMGIRALCALNLDLAEIQRDIKKSIKRGAMSIFMGELPPSHAARKIIEYATAEARRLEKGYVGTEDLLHGLLREPTNIAGQLLRRKFTLERFGEAVNLAHTISAKDPYSPASFFQDVMTAVDCPEKLAPYLFLQLSHRRYYNPLKAIVAEALVEIKKTG